MLSSTTSILNSRLQSTSFPATPLSSLYPLLQHCISFLDVIHIAQDISSTPPLSEAVAFAATCHEAIDMDTIIRDEIFAKDNGLLQLFGKYQQQLHHRTLKWNQLPSPDLLFPILPIISVQDYRSSTNQSHSTLPPLFIDRSNLIPFNLPASLASDLYSLSLTDKRNFIARHGAPILRPPSFIPNQGFGCTILPESIAPQSVIAIHHSRAQRKGTGVILPLELSITLCKSTHLDLNVSTSFIVPKPPLGRNVSNYSPSHTPSSLNSEFKKSSLSYAYTNIENPYLADVCQAAYNATVVFPTDTIIGFRMDIDEAYKRVKILPSDITLCALLFYIELVPYLFFPLVDEFGSQDSNYHFMLVTREIVHRSHLRVSNSYNCQLTGGYTDDFGGFGSQSFVTSEIAHVTSDCISVVADVPISDPKTIIGTTLPLLGFHFDLTHMRVGVLEKHYIKMISQLFVSVPINVQPYDYINIRLLQSIGSNMMRLANVLPSLLCFSRGLHNNLRHYSASQLADPLLRIKLNHRSIVDIWVWRIFFVNCFHDSRHLSVSMSVPIIFRYLPSESIQNDALHSARCLRHANTASYVLHGDACTTGGSHLNGLGGYIHNIGWYSTAIDQLINYYNASDTLVPIDINVLEFLASILSILCLLLHLRSHNVTTIDLHIHVYTDNTSAKSWLTRQISTHPLHAFLLQVLTHVQVHFGIILTYGYLKGELNIYADAASRHFNVPNGASLRSYLSQYTRFPTCTTFLQRIVSVATKPSMTISQVAVKSHTVAEELISWLYAPNSTSQ